MIDEYKSPSDLEAELAIARELLQIEHKAGRISSANAILTTIGRLAKIYDDLLVRHGQTLSKDAVTRLAHGIGQIMLEELEVINEFEREEILDRIMARIFAIASAASNEKAELNKLLGRDH